MSPLPPLYSRLLVATGGAPHSVLAVERAAQLAEHYGAAIHLVTVIPQGQGGLENVALALGAGGPDTRTAQAERQRFETHLQQTAQALRSRGLTVREHLVTALKPADAILTVAHDVQADLIVLGRRHTSAWSAALAGSVSDMVSHASPVDVLVVR
ncbi:universal stress protein [Deinococcus sp. HMF7604]|uniref:universal stress protein n=1 Tax=Deinococcus betulae TaxID=2873312 RepID=UPI001CCF9A49|nr:universal stress protein [Deinococcus betulae]MBZ9751525.1 universal stress protein [Deinococcus betulae]